MIIRVVLFAVVVGIASQATAGVPMVFLEPVPGTAEDAGFQRVTEREQLASYDSWSKNPSAERALALYGLALDVAEEFCGDVELPEALYVVIQQGGNEAGVGLRLVEEGQVEELENTPYIVLAPQPWRFSTTLLHETGHAALSLLACGQEIPRRELAPLPHTTAALTDRGTALDEGFAIHLETLAAHLSDEPHMRGRYRHEQVLFGDAWPGTNSEYHRHAADLLTYSQTAARYVEVRDNNFAFVSASREPSYPRVQQEKARDFATLRDANQLLQSEGFYASFFFSWLMRGKNVPSEATIAERQGKLMRAIAAMLKRRPPQPDTPHLVYLVTTYCELYPDERDDLMWAFLDLTHGVFVDPAAADLWRQHYLAALSMDLENVGTADILAARQRWHGWLVQDPDLLLSLLGPQVHCTVPDVKVSLAALGAPVPLSFDVNTAEEGVLRLIPGIADEEVERWLNERAERPFFDAADLLDRVRLAEGVRDLLEFPEG